MPNLVAGQQRDDRTLDVCLEFVREGAADTSERGLVCVAELVENHGADGFDVVGSGRLEPFKSFVGQDGEPTASVGSAFFAAHQPGLLHASHLMRQAAAAGQGDSGEIRHPHLTFGAFRKPHQNLVVGQRQLVSDLQVAAEPVRKQGAQRNNRTPRLLFVV